MGVIMGIPSIIPYDRRKRIKVGAKPSFHTFEGRSIAAIRVPDMQFSRLGYTVRLLESCIQIFRIPSLSRLKPDGTVCVFMGAPSLCLQAVHILGVGYPSFEVKKLQSTTALGTGFQIFPPTTSGIRMPVS